MAFRYLDYDACRRIPNVVVDGLPNDATVLTLSHWPGASTPEPYRRDLSAEIAFAYLDAAHDASGRDAGVVTCNHFDEDGLVAVHALVDPDSATAHRDLLVAVAMAGDFSRFDDRRAARASMVINRWGDQGMGYLDALPLLVPLARNPEPFRDLWYREDAWLAAGENDLLCGAVTVEELPELDLAMFVVGPSARGVDQWFPAASINGLHPMAVCNATQRFRLFVAREGRYVFMDRYETWVQYQSRPTLPRIDLRPLAATLTAIDRVQWMADSPDEIMPTLTHEGSSTLPLATVTDLLTARLRAASTPVT